MVLSIGLVLGAVLVARGQLVFGVLLAGFAAFRIVFIFLIVRRRRGPGWAAAPNEVRELLRSLVPGELEAAARIIGVDPGELRRDVVGGRSIAESAVAAGVASDDVVDAIVRYASGRVDQLVAEGAVSPETAAQAKERLPLWSARFVERRNGGPRRSRAAS